MVKQDEGGVEETPNQHVMLVHPMCEMSVAKIRRVEGMVGAPKAVDAVQFADDGLRMGQRS